MKTKTNKLKIALATITLMLMQACASTGSKLAADGSVEELKFPQASSAWVKDGVTPNINNLRKISEGMTKDDVYVLLGRPHFSEGFFKVREWDYVFHLTKQDGSRQQTCHYKIIYDNNMRLKSGHWQEDSCTEWLKLETVAEAKIVEKIVTVPGADIVRVMINSDGIFDFDKSGLQDIRPGGLAKIDRVLAEIQAGGEINKLNIFGHTDRLGTVEYNKRLSQARAETIRDYLASKGVPKDLIVADGIGSNNPLIECKQLHRDESLIRCLEPNRRFEIQALIIKR